MKLGNDDMGKNWSHVDFCSPEGHPVTLHYCQTVEECEKILPKYLNEPVVGFDMEWCFPNVGKSPRKNVSLIQVANESSIALIHIGRMNKEDGTPESDDKLVPPTLRALLETDKIMKVGVNIGGDARRLRTFLDVKSQGMLELSDLHHVVYCAQENEKVIPKRLIALKRLTEYHMSLPLDKGEVRTSDWCAPITTEQMGYAATDAYVGLRLFDVLEMKRSKLHPKPRLPIFKGGDPENPSEPGYSGPEAPYVGTTRTASPKKPPHPAVAKANAWIDCYLAEHTSAIPGKAALRAWAMWHVFGHDVPAICALCREPPLQPSTVVGYILEAVWKDQLPYDPARLHAVIEMLQPMRRPSYAWMLTRSADDEAVKVVGDYGLA
ncbi:ribonuclease H-like domain-containing protein [Geopyxis carbonaria]|nr:ribonuclease H-like domain-containing protein [Geopyxis carbonaria]